MATNDDEQDETRAVDNGERAAAGLQEALIGAGFLFPSLSGDYPVRGRAHVRLGGMSAEEAVRFAAWIRERTS